MTPLVSICCLTYNHAEYLRQCLDGFLMQKINFSYEILIHDDASTDNTPDIIKKYEIDYPDCIRAMYQNENQFSKGVSPTRAHQLRRVRGKYIAFCEGDDYWTDPCKLQKQVDFLENNPSYSGCHTLYNIVTMENKILHYEKGVKREFSHLDVLEKGCPKTLTLMIRTASRQFTDNLDGVNYSKIKNGDQFLCALITLNGPIGFLNYVTGNYRDGSGFWSSKKPGQQSITAIDSFLEMCKVFNSSEEHQAIAKRLNRNLSKIPPRSRLPYISKMKELNLPLSVWHQVFFQIFGRLP